MHFINNTFGKSFIFHLNVSFKSFVLHQFLTFYANILYSWKRNFSHISYTRSCIGSQFLYLATILQLITILKNFRATILTLSISYLHLRENLKTGITQISHVIPKNWKQIIRENRAETCVMYLQSFAKYIWNLLGFTENIDLKYKFNVAFWLFSTR